MTEEKPESEVKEVKVEESTVGQAQETEVPKEPQQERKSLEGTARILALKEIETLTNVINSVEYIPKFDNGNNGKQDRKLVGSIPVNLFDHQTLDLVGKRIFELIKLL